MKTEQLIAYLQQFNPKSEIAVLMDWHGEYFTSTHVELDMDDSGVSPVMVVSKNVSKSKGLGDRSNDE